jgi:hypothetical protein
MRQLMVLRLEYRSRFLGGPGIADIKGNVGATRSFTLYPLPFNLSIWPLTSGHRITGHCCYNRFHAFRVPGCTF